MDPITIGTKNLERRHYKVLTGKEDVSLTEALLAFESKSNKTKRVVEARDFLVRNWVLKRISEQGFFDFKSGIIPFKNVCPKCSGAGNRFKFFKLDKDSSCRKCKGVGRSNGKTCITCNGKGIFTRIVTEPVMKSYNQCRHCKGLGYFEEMDNPVIPRNLVEQLSLVVSK